MTWVYMSLIGGLMILVIAAFRQIALHRLPKRLLACLWLIAALRLILPVWIPVEYTVPAPVMQRVEMILPEAADRPILHLMQESEVQTLPPVVQDRQESSVQAAAPEAKPDWLSLAPKVLRTVYLAGAAVMLVHFGMAYCLTYRRYARSFPVSNQYLRAFRKSRSIPDFICFRESTLIASPLTYGILRPVILLPADLDWKDPESRRENEFMLEHEWMHIRRGDVALKFLINVILCLHWSNPCVWLMHRLWNRDLELACDEAVLAHCGDDERAEYARTLLRVGEWMLHEPVAENRFSSNRMKERIIAIMKKKNITVLAVCIALLITAALLTGFMTLNPKAASAQAENAPATPAPSETVVQNDEETSDVAVVGGVDDSAVVVLDTTADDSAVAVLDTTVDDSADVVLDTTVKYDVPEPVKAKEGDLVKTHVLEQDAEYVFVEAFEEETAPRKSVRMSVKDAVLQDGTIRMADIDWFMDEETLVPLLYGLDKNGLSEFGSYWNQGWIQNMADVRLAVAFEDTQGMQFYPRYVFQEGKLTSAQYSYPMTGVHGFDNTDCVDWETYQKDMKVILNALFDLGLNATMTREEALRVLEQGDPQDNIACTIHFTSDDPNGAELCLMHGWYVMETRDPANLNDPVLYTSEHNYCNLWLYFPEIEKANMD